LSLAAALRRSPDEVESMGFHDAVTLMGKMNDDEVKRMKFEAQLAGCTLK
jgi:hypothetical protein